MNQLEAQTDQIQLGGPPGHSGQGVGDPIAWNVQLFHILAISLTLNCN